MYLALDPGKTTGFAIFDTNGDITWLGDKQDHELEGWLESLGPDIEVVIIEEFRNYPGVPQNFGKNPTSQVIAKIISWANKQGIQVVELPAQVRKIGYKYMGMKPPKKKSETHQWDACAHGVYWLTRHKIRKIRI